MLTAPSRPAFGRTCAVCGATVLPGVPMVPLAPDVAGERALVAVCGQVACRSRVASVPAVANCAACARPLRTAAARAAGACGTEECRALQRLVERSRARSVRRHRALARLDAAARALRDAAAAAAGDVPVALVPSTDEEAFPMFLPPPYAPPVVRLPPRRRRAFLAHVRRVAAAADAEALAAAEAAASMGASAEVAAEAPPEAPPETTAPPSPVESRADSDADPARALYGAACAMCGGRCCRHGGEHAYLTAQSVRAWREARPGKHPEAVVTAYAAHLPRESVAESCVYHTRAGCALPREMRSRTCNSYLCDGLAGLRAVAAERAAEGRPLRRAFLAVIEDGELARWGMADAGDGA